MTASSQILEVVVFNVQADVCDEFADAFQVASDIITSMPGYISHELHRSAEVSSSYILLINWRSLKHHTISFRQLPDYERWRSLLESFIDPVSNLKNYYGPSLINPPVDDRLEPAVPNTVPENVFY
jgi:heme-degrading monooxygenase HmoA